MSRKSVYPPDDGPDPFVYDGTRQQAVAESIVQWFVRGQTVDELRDDFTMTGTRVERVLRWWIARRMARVVTK
jgi:hypothetical protein